MPVEFTIAIPTYGRDEILVNTIASLIEIADSTVELLIVDQTSNHTSSTIDILTKWRDQGLIRWIRLTVPSITVAMNTALAEANGEIVLFLDDDIEPAEGLIRAHRHCYGDTSIWAVAGQVLQPGEQPTDVPDPTHGVGLKADLRFPFNSTQRSEVSNVMAGNLSVRRDRAKHIGGFDENFVLVAYRFETDFARRVIGHGGRILFEPEASIRHLRAPTGGTRHYIDHRQNHRPDHSVGDYYFALMHSRGIVKWRYCMGRLIRSVFNRYHLARPWWIAPKLLGELRGLLMAIRLAGYGRQQPFARGADDSDRLGEPAPEHVAS